MSDFEVVGLSGQVANCHVYDLHEAIKASKYPMSVDVHKVDDSITKTVCGLGKAPRGSGHDNFLKGIHVAFDLTLSNKAWVEAERYHFFEIVSSQSTMHCAVKFKLANQCNEYVDPEIILVIQKKIDLYNEVREERDNCKIMERVNELNFMLTQLYLQILYNLPSGFRLTARISTNYQQLKTIYFQRKDHRLPEWRSFCRWMHNLPYFDEIVLGKES